MLKRLIPIRTICLGNSKNGYTLKDGKYIGSKPYVPGENVTTALLPGLEIELGEIFR